MTEARPIAEPDDLTEPWWEATKEERLLLQRCRDCNQFQHYPRALCTHCHSTDLDYVESAGRGEIYSFSVIHRPPHPAFTPPYILALIRLAEGPVLLSNIVEAAEDSIRCDTPVELRWEPLPDGRKLPLFAPTNP
jgi:uncharacterized OB-fold protein